VQKKGKSFFIKRREKSAKPIGISVCTIKTLREKAFGKCNLFRHISIGIAGRKMERSRIKDNLRHGYGNAGNVGRAGGGGG
jgi:hypothetical protein